MSLLKYMHGFMVRKKRLPLGNKAKGQVGFGWKHERPPGVVILKTRKITFPMQCPTPSGFAW